jgi:L-aspartate oxidase
MDPKIYNSDFLVIGSGIAGLAFAIKVSKFGTVHIVTKKKNFDSSTNYAQGGIASVLAPGDAAEHHMSDTLKAGAGLCNPRAVEVLVKSGPDRIQELIDWGTQFTYKEEKDGSHVLDLGREGGHSCNRIVHALDLTGKIVEQALLDKIAQIPTITIFEDHTAVDLLTEHQLRFVPSYQYKANESITCFGAYILENKTSTIHTFNAKLTLIASGGAGNVYLHTTNPSIATGDGIAMGYRAGALVTDMEFMQFHPTAFYKKNAKGRSLLISEAVRGEGAHLYNSQGTRFMDGVHELKELAPRDIVARAIDKELKRLGDPCVYLDISFKDSTFLKERFPFIYANCLKEGVDITREPIPVVPAAHYLCGGIVSDLAGRTSIAHLYVAGEAGCTGVHGANRLASNSLLEALVFADKAAEDAIHCMQEHDTNIRIPECPIWNKEGTFDPEEWVLIQHDVEEIKRLMWDYVGIVRSDLRLERAYRRIMFLEEEIRDYYKRSTVSVGLIELRNLATIARLIIRGAMARKESRGLHYNTNYPDQSEDNQKNIIQSTNQEQEMAKLEKIFFPW